MDDKFKQIFSLYVLASPHQEMDAEFYVTVTLLFLIMTLSLLGNIILIISVLTTRELKGHTGILILNLSISDLCITCFSLPLRLCQMFGANWSNNYVSCSITVALTISFFTASNFNLLLVTLDRFLNVLYPAKYRLNLTKLKLRVAIAVSWLASCFIAFLPMFLARAKKIAKSVDTAFVCRYETVLFPKYLIFVVFFTLLVPWVSMISMYAAILKVVLFKPSKVDVVSVRDIRCPVEAGKKMIEKSENSGNSQGVLVKANIKSDASESRCSIETGRVACIDRERITETATGQRQTSHRLSIIKDIKACDILNVIEGSQSNDKGTAVGLNLERACNRTVEQKQDSRHQLDKGNVEECPIVEGSRSNKTDKVVSLNLERIVDTKVESRQKTDSKFGGYNLKDCDVNEEDLSNEIDRNVSLNPERMFDRRDRLRQCKNGDFMECDMNEGCVSNETNRAVCLKLEQTFDKKVEPKQTTNSELGSEHIKEGDVGADSLSKEEETAFGWHLAKFDEEPESDEQQSRNNDLRSKGLGIRKLQETKLVKGVFIILIFYTIQMVPFGFIDLLELNGTISVPDVVIRIAMILAYLNSAVNPPIYAASNKRYRASFWRILSSCRHVERIQYDTDGRVVVRADQVSDADFVTGQPSRM